MSPTLDQLKVLDAIARTGSFAGAAEALHRVPSAVSYAVRQLEETLEVELFDRSRRTAALTPAGERLLEAAREVLRSTDGLEELARDLAGGWEPELRVVVDGALPLRPFLAALGELHRPDVPTRVRLEVEHRMGVLHAFDAGPCQLMAVIGFAPDDDVSAYDCVALPPLELVRVVAAAHPLATDPSVRAHHPELVVRDSSPGRDARTDGQHGIALSDFHAKRLALLDGVGFGWIPRHLVERDLAEGQLVPLALDETAPRFTYGPQLVRRRGAARGRAERHFTDALARQFE